MDKPSALSTFFRRLASLRRYWLLRLPACQEFPCQLTLNGNASIVLVALAAVPVIAGGVQRYTTMLESL
ncbi:hypothetical protein P0D71_12695, partial [Paraburkholderia sp. RL17-383-BIF-A]|uniref:hypothetical protein n=1 Tax=Paraburkholderia sp. RL17-383-BIF-A TaxID=3031631 RepID=UPI0038B92949